ncbi:uncharacterized protein [Montipora foliosa]|uniref:uncharacterized protein n=1 Tax=Montipora foliosa TaxID=591990 RepID=UPI0035F1F99D
MVRSVQISSRFLTTDQRANSLQGLQSLVYIAAQTGALQFIELIFSTSAGQIVFDSYKDRTPSPEDIARACGHDDLANYLQDLTTRFSEEPLEFSLKEAHVIDWLELEAAATAALTQGCFAEEKSSDDSSENNSSTDYFADVETSSIDSSGYHTLLRSTSKDDISERFSEEKMKASTHQCISSIGKWAFAGNDILVKIGQIREGVQQKSSISMLRDSHFDFSLLEAVKGLDYTLAFHLAMGSKSIPRHLHTANEKFLALRGSTKPQPTVSFCKLHPAVDVLIESSLVKNNNDHISRTVASKQHCWNQLNEDTFAEHCSQVPIEKAIPVEWISSDISVKQFGAPTHWDLWVLTSAFRPTGKTLFVYFADRRDALPSICFFDDEDCESQIHCWKWKRSGNNSLKFTKMQKAGELPPGGGKLQMESHTHLPVTYIVRDKHVLKPSESAIWPSWMHAMMHRCWTIDSTKKASNLTIFDRSSGALRTDLTLSSGTVAIQIEKLGSQHIRVADSYKNLAVVLCGHGELEQAKEYLERAEYTDEQLNYFKICFIATDVISEGLRTIFKQEWDNRYKATLGEWKDEPRNGLDFKNQESPRAQRKYAGLLATMVNGNRAEWDCTMLFYAILYSDSIGRGLNAVVRSNVDDLRCLRNKNIAHLPQGHVKESEFQTAVDKVVVAFQALGLFHLKIQETRKKSFPTDELRKVLQVVDHLKDELKEKERELKEKVENLKETEKHRKVLEEQLQIEAPAAFCILPPKPSHDVAERNHELAEIPEQLKQLKETNESRLPFLCISGKSVSGKSHLAKKQFAGKNTHVPISYHNIGNVLHAQGDLELAKAYLERAVELEQAKEYLDRAEYTDEQLNYFKICFIATDVISEGLRTIFKQEWDNRYKATLGEWKDEPRNGLDFKNQELPSTQRKNAGLLATMVNGNRAEWDCTMLFYAILYSDSIGRGLNAVVRSNVDDLRCLRNKNIAHLPQGHVKESEFQTAVDKVVVAFQALGLFDLKIQETRKKSFPTDELRKVLQVVDHLKDELKEKERELKEKVETLKETEKHRKVLEEQLQIEAPAAFCILPPKPSHDVAERDHEVAKIIQQLQQLKETNESRLTSLYLSGNPGSGKSQLAGLVAKKFFDEKKQIAGKNTFVMTLNAQRLDSLLESYVSFSRNLKCSEYAVTSTLNDKDLKTEGKIANIKSLISTKVELYSSWLLVVDNVVSLSGMNPHLPETGDTHWSKGQLLITLQDTTAIPSETSFSNHISVSKGMTPSDAISLLASLSGIADGETEKEVARALDYQPLALASAAIFVKQVREASSNFGWKGYLEKLETGQLDNTEAFLAMTNQRYPISMTTAISLAVDDAMSSDKVLNHAFGFTSLRGQQQLNLDLVIKFILTVENDIHRSGLDESVDEDIIGFEKALCC